jgi:hypothetical protein
MGHVRIVGHLLNETADGRIPHQVEHRAPQPRAQGTNLTCPFPVRYESEMGLSPGELRSLRSDRGALLPRRGCGRACGKSDQGRPGAAGWKPRTSKKRGAHLLVHWFDRRAPPVPGQCRRDYEPSQMAPRTAQRWHSAKKQRGAGDVSRAPFTASARES